MPELHERCVVCGEDLELVMELIAGVCNACAEEKDSGDTGGDTGDGG